MAFTATEQALYDFAVNSLPWWYRYLPRQQEILEAFVKCFDRARQDQITAFGTYALIEQSTGIWLDLHAADRGLRRQDGETDVSLRARIKNIEDVVTRPALLQAADNILDAAGIADPPLMLELKRDRAFLGTYVAQTGTGGTFVDVGAGDYSFEPDTPFALPVEVNFTRSGAQGNPRLVISGAANAGNNGTFEVTSLADDAVVFANGSGVAGADATVSWSLRQYDIEGNDRTTRARSYLGRGYRAGSDVPHVFVMILPFGTPESVRLSVEDMLRVKKAAGVVRIAERRENP